MNQSSPYYAFGQNSHTSGRKGGFGKRMFKG